MRRFWGVHVQTDKDRYYRSPKRIDPTTTYVFPRTLGGGVILGGSREDNNWSNEWDSELEAQILESACKLAPELGKPENLQIIARNIGLRREYKYKLDARTFANTCTSIEEGRTKNRD